VTFILNNTYATGNATGGNYVGGLVGYASPNYSTHSFVDIMNSSSYGSVNGASYVGGILGGNANATTATFLSNDTSYGNVNGTGNYVGGIAGYTYSITGSTARGVVTGANYVGGIAGGTYIVSNSYYGGNSVSGTGPYVGNQAGNVATSATGNHDLPDDQKNPPAPPAPPGNTSPLPTQPVSMQQTSLEVSATAQAGQTVGQALQRGVNPSGGVGSAATVAEQRASVGSGIVFEDSDSYSAGVKSISADGVTLEMEDNSSK